VSFPKDAEQIMTVWDYGVAKTDAPISDVPLTNTDTHEKFKETQQITAKGDRRKR